MYKIKFNLVIILFLSIALIYFTINKKKNEGYDTNKQDCKLSEWENKGKCSKPCGGGTIQVTRRVLSYGKNGGKICPKNLEETIPCNTQPCPVDCKTRIEWSKCSKKCGGGRQTGKEVVANEASHGGKVCGSYYAGGLRTRIESTRKRNIEGRDCNTHHCPIDCEVSGWGRWGSCSKTCGGGERERTRTVTTKPEHDGKQCPTLSETQDCNTHKCPIDCKVSGWSSWSSCSKTCGGGERERTRTVTTKPEHDGKQCPALSQTRVCNTHTCPPNIVLKQNRYGCPKQTFYKKSWYWEGKNRKLIPRGNYYYCCTNTWCSRQRGGWMAMISKYDGILEHSHTII